MNTFRFEKPANEKYFPNVILDANTGICEISGESYMEEPSQFYGPIIKWFDDYSTEKKESIELNIKLNYFNTSSSKMLLIILSILKDFEKNNGKIKVSWFYPAGDIDIEDEIDDFSLETGVEIAKVEI